MNLGREMPHDLAAERQILGSIMMYETVFDEVAGLISADDFYTDANRKIFYTLSEIANKGQKINTETYIHGLERNGWLQECGMIDLTGGLPRLKHVDTYAEMVRESARQRYLIASFTSAIENCYDKTPPDVVIGKVESEMLSALQKGRKFKLRTMAEIAQQTWQNIERLRTLEQDCIGLHTGLSALDRATTGYRNGEYYVIGARPGQGKTSLACQSIRANCKAGIKTAFFSIEMTEEQVMLRFLSMETGIDLFELRDSRSLSRWDREKIQLALGVISEWPLVIDDSSKVSIHELVARSRMLIKQDCKAIYVDYLQRVQGDGRSPFDKVTSVSEGLCELAKSSDIPVIALSQLRRGETGAAGKPTLDDLRQSGQIEQDAHAVFLLYREKDADGYTGKDEIIIAKQRSGPSGQHINVEFQGHTTEFKPRLPR